MLRWMLDLPYGQELADFPSPYPVEIALQRLKSTTSRTVLKSLFREAAVGAVTIRRVAISHHRPWFRNSFSPAFVGTFTADGGKTPLRGGFRLNRFASIFMTFWLGFTALWTVLVTALTLADPKIWWFPFVGAGMFTIGTLFAWGARRLSRSDVTWLSEHIRAALA